jgi:hypothetical protein
MNLGLLLIDRGRHGEAFDVLTRVEASGHVDQAPLASFTKGQMLEEDGYLDEAVDAYQAAAMSPDDEIAGQARGALSRLRT